MNTAPSPPTEVMSGAPDVLNAPDASDAAEVAAFFDTLKCRHLDTQVRGLTGTCRFEIRSTGSWLLAITDGYIDVRQTHDPADSVVQCTPQEFLRIVRCQQNCFTSALQGKLRVSGNLALVQILGRMGLYSRANHTALP